MHVTLIENFRAIFYAPFYVAFALKAFEAEGLDVVLQPSAAADKTLSTMTAGANTVSWGGPMRLMHALDASPAAGVVAFCEVVCRDPFYLVGRAPKPDFHMRDLVNAKLAVVSEVPTPWYCLRHDLRLAGIDPARVPCVSGRTMAENAASLRAGESECDVIQVFEPYAHALVEEGAGHIWYAAASRGATAYTTLNTTRAFIEREPDLVLRMTRAMFRTQQWIAAHDGAALARLVASYFPDVPLTTLVACVERYKANALWNTTPLPLKAGVAWLNEAMLACGAIKTRFAYEDIVEARFAEQVMREKSS
jgi:NitT/TauT family transport system substrate-binding protein